MPTSSRVGPALRRALGEPPSVEATPRASGPSVLLNRRRLEVFWEVARRPGIHARELGRATSVPLQSLLWHLRALEGAGLVRSRRLGKFTILSVPGTVPDSHVPALAALDIVRHAAIARTVLQAPRSRRELSRTLKTYPQALDGALRSMRGLGLLERDARGLWFPGPNLFEILDAASSGRSARLDRLFALLARDGLDPAVVRKEDPWWYLEVNGPRRRIELKISALPDQVRVLTRW